MSYFNSPRVTKFLNKLYGGFTNLPNSLPKSWGMSVCPGGHNFIDNRERFFVIDSNKRESFSYDQYICTKCGVEERRSMTQHRVEERRLFTKCDGTGGWKLPECLQF